MPIVVKKKPGESDDKLINRFRLQVKDEDIVRKARELKEHTPKSEERKQRKARIKHLRELEKRRNKLFS